jgi:protein phosphatase
MTALEVATGHASRAGTHAGAGAEALNEDFCGYSTPTGATLASKGMLLALADGVSGSRGGRDSAAFAVRGLLADFYASPDTWSVTHALDRVIHAINHCLVGQAVSQRGQEGLQTTL